MIDFWKNNKGESLAETLIASLIIGLAMIMVLSISQVTSRLTNQADSDFSNYYNKMNLYEMLELENLNDSSYISSTTASATLYVDGYELGSENVVIYTDTRTIDGISINYSFIG
ncbi:MAG: hypothetical protein MJ094_04580 [Saccharofermentans sp.]|nr:hypothetical protein [Saccharofermentans sp.]